MRLVSKHAQIGYQIPGDRPSCRNCAHFEQVRHDSPVIAPRQACTKHDLEVTSGGICHDHKLQRLVTESDQEYRVRHLELACARLDELHSFIPQNGEMYS